MSGKCRSNLEQLIFQYKCCLPVFTYKLRHKYSFTIYWQILYTLRQACRLHVYGCMRKGSSKDKKKNGIHEHTVWIFSHLRHGKSRAKVPRDWFFLCFRLHASSKWDMVLLNTIKKAEPWHYCNQTERVRRNEGDNSRCCICTFIYCPFPIPSLFCQCEGCVYKLRCMTGLIYQVWVTRLFY